MINRLLPVVCFALLLSSAAHADCPLPGARVALHQFPPYYHSDSAGNIRGSLIELLDRIEARLGCDWRYAFYPVPRLLASLTSGTADLAMLIKHPSLDRAHYGTVAVAELRLQLYRQPDQPLVRQLADLPTGARLIVRRGYGYHGLINPLLQPDSGVIAIPADSHQQAVELLKNRAADYLLNYAGPSDYFLQQSEMNHIDGQRIAAWPVYLVLSEKVRDGQQLIQQLDQLLISLGHQPAASD